MEKESVKNLFVYATKDEEVAREVQELIEKKHSTTKTVRLEDKLLDDYEKSLKRAETKPKTVEEFVSDRENQNLAETKALTLWNLLTHNADYNKSMHRVFTKAEIVQRTNLTNSKLSELLELFHLFGLIEYTKGSHEFRFTFSEKTRQAGVYSDIIEDISHLNSDIARYKAMFKEEELKEVREELLELVKLMKF